MPTLQSPDQPEIHELIGLHRLLARLDMEQRPAAVDARVRRHLVDNLPASVTASVEGAVVVHPSELPDSAEPPSEPVTATVYLEPMNRATSVCEFRTNHTSLLRVDAADLWLPIAGGGRVTVNVSLTDQGAMPYSELFTVQPAAEHDYHQIDLLAAARQWHAMGETAVLHVVSCFAIEHTTLIQQIAAANALDRPGDEQRHPFIELRTTTPVVPATAVNTRHRRRLDRCSPSESPHSLPSPDAATYSGCCLIEHYINFTTIGWNDWIVRPDGFWSNYCTGNCRNSTTVYSHVSRIEA